MIKKGKIVKVYGINLSKLLKAKVLGTYGDDNMYYEVELINDSNVGNRFVVPYYHILENIPFRGKKHFVNEIKIPDIGWRKISCKMNKVEIFKLMKETKSIFISINGIDYTFMSFCKEFKNS